MVEVEYDESTAGDPAEDAPKPRRATVEDLEAKKPAERELPFRFSATGEPLSVLLRAIGARRWDALVMANPPTEEQRAEGQDVNIDRFAPMLLAEVVVEPQLDEKWWRTRWEGAAWSRGELGSLYFAAQELCNKGLDPAPTSRD